MGERSYEADCPSPFGTTAKRKELNMAGCCHSNSVMGVLTYNGCDSLRRALTERMSTIRLFSQAPWFSPEDPKLVSEWRCHLFKKKKGAKISAAQLGEVTYFTKHSASVFLYVTVVSENKYKWGAVNTFHLPFWTLGWKADLDTVRDPRTSESYYSSVVTPVSSHSKRCALTGHVQMIKNIFLLYFFWWNVHLYNTCCQNATGRETVSIGAG